MSTAESVARDWGDTHRIRATVRATGNRTFDGSLHLLPYASFHLGPETPEDVLNRDEAFFPLTDDRGRTVFLAKDQVLLVEVPSGAESDPDRRNAAKTMTLLVELSDGSEWMGTVSSELPPTRTRAIDFLNLAAGFFALREAELVRFINRAHVRIATPSD